MEFLNQILLKDPDYASLLSDVQKNRLPVACTGLSQVHKAVSVAALHRHAGRKIAILTHDEASAGEIKDDLTSLGLKCLHFPVRDYCLGNLSGYSREYEHKRIDTLSALTDGDFDALTFCVDAGIQYTMPPEILQSNRFLIKVGQSISLTDLTTRLTAAGYVRCELCDGTGQFAVRGGILDIYPVNAPSPYRIEFWGDDIDSIAVYDTDTQRRTQQIEEITVSPACEVLYNDQDLLAVLGETLKTKGLTDKQKSRIEADIGTLKGDLSVPPDRYIPFIYKNGDTVFDYLGDTQLIVSESGGIAERLKSMFVQQSMDTENYLEDGFLSKKTAKLWLDKNELYGKLDKAVIFENFPRTSYYINPKDLINFNFKRSTPWSGDMTVLLEDISYILETGGSVVILAGEKKAATVLNEELNEKGIKSVFSETPQAGQAGVAVSTGGLSSGLEIVSAKFLLITHRYIAADGKKHKKRPKNAKEIGSLEELKAGDYVVHESHGIGIFGGINRITNGGVTKDYIKIQYAKTDVLYVPVTQLDLVSKYIGGSGEDSGIKLNRLGGTEWQKTRTRVRAAVKDMAKQLTALYAKRMSSKGYAFSQDTDLQNDFERRFEYEETEDQLRCIDEIKRDMEREVPMDRLLCGDVGFGKTEVALRAAFKCISEGKQCALLVPTTILAMQHYNTILRRFGDMPVTVKMLSRFVPPKQQENTIKELKRGTVDMVVGTHRLISKDVAFKDIGLVIIDEEQRFGVAQKERLKELYPHVDILVLSATPIPRTLNMAMSGLRDMSSIDEAPGDRHPVQTYVLERDMGVLCDAINKELRRGGQVYYLHNRVESIERCAARLKQRIPDARFGVAHGKMGEEELTRVWKQLIEHEIDVLVCTTIIETGVDVANANTLIIESADRMGLSQLHQLRGRVGRSPRRAYAYFCFDTGKQLTDVAAKRLEAIREYTEFGSGLKIAMRDLEIRGAGSVLGGEQHGNMESVGYDMYLKLLSDAVNEENGVEVEPEVNCTVDLNISAHIPENYIASLPARLGIYKRIAAIRNDDDASDVIDELCDRFGGPPDAVMGLINIALLRSRAAAACITEITGAADSALLHITSIRPDVMAKLSESFGSRYRLIASDSPVYSVKLKKDQKMSDFVEELSRVL